MNTTFQNTGHSFTESGFFDEKENQPEPSEQNTTKTALQKLLQLHEREMTDDTITVKEWQDAVKNGQSALENLTFKK